MQSVNIKIFVLCDDMFTFNKVFVITLLGCMIACLQAQGNIKAVEVQPRQLVELKVEQDELGNNLYTYKCTVGSNKSGKPKFIFKRGFLEYFQMMLIFMISSAGRIGCNGGDHTTWTTPRDVVLTLRCPPNDFGPIIAYVEIIYTVTTQSVYCRVIDGGVGSSYIQMEVDAYGTEILDYSSNFYVY